MPPRPVRIVAISDTHDRHDGLALPPGDVLIHGGDFTSRGRVEEVVSFLRWFAGRPHPHKILIAGNHDWLFERDPALARELLSEHAPRVVYLEDSGASIQGLRFWGSPYQPEFFDWAFNLPRGPGLAQRWALIPSDTDVLITHGPPLGVLDLCADGRRVGCEALAAELSSRLRPRLHVFGHIHEAYGVAETHATTFANASVCTLRYIASNQPLLFTLDPASSAPATHEPCRGIPLR